MLRNIFKKKEPYDYGRALEMLAKACEASKAFSIVFPSVYFDYNHNEYTVHFECAQREVFNKNGRSFYAIRRDEKFRSADLERLLDFAIEYTNYPDAFRLSPKGNLPEGITFHLKNFTRTPHNYSLSRKL